MPSFDISIFRLICVFNVAKACLVPCDEECRRLGNPIFRPKPAQYEPDENWDDLEIPLFRQDSSESDYFGLLPTMKRKCQRRLSENAPINV